MWRWRLPTPCRRRGGQGRATVRTGDLTGLRNLAQKLYDKLVAGYILYTGEQTLP